jgi:large conductance mechanosensitive channel
MMRSWGSEFKEFILRGNVVSLAVAVIIGAAFNDIVNALVANMVTPLIAAIGGKPDFSDISFTINNSEFGLGLFLNAVISFLIIALVVFFLIVKPMNLLIERSKREEPESPALKKCPYCMTDVPLDATRCRACTSDLASTSAAV